MTSSACKIKTPWGDNEVNEGTLKGLGESKQSRICPPDVVSKHAAVIHRERFTESASSPVAIFASRSLPAKLATATACEVINLSSLWPRLLRPLCPRKRTASSWRIGCKLANASLRLLTLAFALTNDCCKARLRLLSRTAKVCLSVRGRAPPGMTCKASAPAGCRSGFSASTHTCARPARRH